MDASVMILGEVLGDVFPEQTIIGGAPYNVARHCHALGVGVQLLSAVGEDVLGERILHEMRAWGLSTRGVQTIPDLPTGQVVVHFEQGGHRFEILDAQAYDALSLSAIRPVLQRFHADLAYIGSLVMRHAPMQQVVASWLRQLDCPVFCDINLRAPWYSHASVLMALQAADVLKINHEELPIVCNLAGLVGSEDLEVAARQLIDAFKLNEVFVTCGEAGSFWVNNAGLVLHAPVARLRRPFVDSVGAGDAYSAIVMRGLLAGAARSEVLAQAADFSAAICSERGAVPADKAFYRDFMRVA
ncbi:PfkB family carbohydrate kinase [Methylophilus aquaticus]|uniref:PfkB family carbohydrate kinase n=1 Tax=Methylophilus aquaticus TaxID=1971610 RepID=A0ABT9JTH2_9PROT|nr:PfkB family carbohydrate kinase [Methylophilus aquaticus]MDP8567873.1 PfkB family carbohydrate kinase [Methylophilus aquaticus]